MELTCREIGRVRVLAVQGRLDHAWTPDFQAALTPYVDGCDERGSPLILDFSGVDYVSSMGLRALMLAAKQAKAQNGQIAVAALQPVVAEIFAISRFNLVFRVFATAEAAANELAP